MPEQGVIIKSVEFDDRYDDLVVQFELALCLSRKPHLLGFYTALKLFKKMGLTTFLPQKILAQYLGLTETTYIKYRNELISLGLLQVEENGSMKGYILGGVGRLQNLESGLQNLESLKLKNGKEALNYLEKTANSLLSFPSKKKGQMELTRSIYSNTTLLNHNTNTNKSNTVTGIPTAKQSVKRFDKIIYTNLIQEYMKYKGIELRGAEMNIAYKAINTMLRSDRTPAQIVAFMKWLKENEHETWVKNWTMWTVQKKLPEFLAGKFKERTMQDDLPRL